MANFKKWEDLPKELQEKIFDLSLRETSMIKVSNVRRLTFMSNNFLSKARLLLNLIFKAKHDKYVAAYKKRSNALIRRLALQEANKIVKVLDKNTIGETSYLQAVRAVQEEIEHTQPVFH